MKRQLLIALAMLAATAPQAFGALSVNDDVRLVTGVNTTATNTSGGGGPFHAYLYEDASTGVSATNINNPGSYYDDFYTFCVQHSETLATWNNLDGLTAGAVTATPRALTGYAAWAFSKFVSDPDFPANISNNSATYVNQLVGYQQAIWAGMVNTFASALTQVGTASSDLNVGGTGGLNNVYLTAAGVTWANFLASNWGGYASGGDNTSGQAALKLAYIGDYRVMNLSGVSGQQTQDQIIVPAPVPEPASIVVWSVLAGGAAGIGVARKRRRSAPQGRWSDENRQAIMSIIDAGK